MFTVLYATVMYSFRNIILSRVGGWLTTGFWIGWLDLLHLIHSYNSGLQEIQRYRYSTHFPAHRYTRTSLISKLLPVTVQSPNMLRSETEVLTHSLNVLFRITVHTKCSDLGVLASFATLQTYASIIPLNESVWPTSLTTFSFSKPVSLPIVSKDLSVPTRDFLFTQGPDRNLSLPDLANVYQRLFLQE
jgi:hypothetical protein